MKTILTLAVSTLLFQALASPCFALREIATVTPESARERGLEVRVEPAGPDAVTVELEFKPEGALKEFTHGELSIRDGKDALVFFSELRDTRSESGKILVTFTIGRAYLRNTTLSVVMHSPVEAGDHTYELRMEDFVDREKAP